MNKTIAAIFSHPDDEVLGCGATLAKHVKQGDEVHILILGTGVTSRDVHDINAIETLKVAARGAASVLGVESVSFVDFSDNQFDTVPLLTVIKPIEAFLLDKKASIIYTHQANDVNIDHQITAKAVLTASRPHPSSLVKRIYGCEINSSTEWQFLEETFSPNYFVDVSSTFNLKQRALGYYEAEMREWPHPRSYKGVEILSNYRGMQSGVPQAEAFMSYFSLEV
jgi:N-acetylglucosamine malate deacetylase 1